MTDADAKKEIDRKTPDEANWRRSDRVESVKLGINNLLWMHGHPDLTLKEAEERACVAMDILLREPLRTQP